MNYYLFIYYFTQVYCNNKPIQHEIGQVYTIRLSPGQNKNMRLTLKNNPTAQMTYSR